MGGPLLFIFPKVSILGFSLKGDRPGYLDRSEEARVRIIDPLHHSYLPESAVIPGRRSVSI